MQILQTIKRHRLINCGEKIAVATSGGSDSICLLNFLYEHKDQLGIEVKCINVEHGIRGVASKKDTQFVANFCKSRNIELYVKVADVLEIVRNEGGGIEQTARSIRYELFDEMLSAGWCDKVAIAHNREDNVETVLMHIFRGCGLNGLTGMKYQHNGIIRPLLDTTKEAIMDYLKNNKLSYCDDETNFDFDYARNYIRHVVIGDIEVNYPAVRKNVIELAKLTKEEDSFLDSLAEKYVFKDKISNAVSVKIDKEIPKVLFSRAVFIALRKINSAVDVGKTHIDSVWDLAQNCENGKQIHMPNSVSVIKEYNKIVFIVDKQKNANNTQKISQENNNENDDKIQSGVIRFREGITQFQGCKVKIKKEKKIDLTKKEKLYFKYSQMLENAVFRTIEQGDVFKPYGSKTKKLSDYFQQKKIPLRFRNSIPILCDKKNVLLVAGVEISDLIKVDVSANNNDDNIWSLELIKENYENK